MNQRTVRIATRESPLAMWQARYVETLLTDAGFITQLVPLTSEGDVDLRPFDAASRQQQAPTVGLFTKRIQQAVLDETADIAVHSLKDLPTATDSRLTLAFVPERGPITDALVHPDGLALDQLPQASIIGTGSRRRGAQLLHVRPDLQVRTIRGNVQTRLQKLSDGEYDAIILATAGLERLEYDQVRRSEIPIDEMLPAPGQGALGIECRSVDQTLVAALRPLNHLPTLLSVTAERTMLACLQGGCLAPIAASAAMLRTRDESGVIAEGILRLCGVVLSGDGQRYLSAEHDVELHHDDVKPASDDPQDDNPRDDESVDTADNPWQLEQPVPQHSNAAQQRTDQWLSLARELGMEVAEMLREDGAEECLAADRSRAT